MKGVDTKIRTEQPQPFVARGSGQIPESPKRPQIEQPKPDQFVKGMPALPIPLLRSGTLATDFANWHAELPKRPPSDLPQIRLTAQKEIYAKEGGAVRKVLNFIREKLSPSFRNERRAYMQSYRDLMSAIEAHEKKAATLPEPRTQTKVASDRVVKDEGALATTKARQPSYTWGLEAQKSWSDKLKGQSDRAVIDQAAKHLADAMQVPINEVRSQFRSRADAEAFLKENMPEPLRFGALGEAPKAAASFIGESHGVPTTWALAAPEFANRYGARSIEGDGSCWLTSGLYSTLSQGFKNDDSAQRLAQSFGNAAHLLARPDIQAALNHEQGFSASPAAARTLAQKAQSLVQDLYVLKKGEGQTLPSSIRSKLSDVEQALLMSHGKDAWRVWMSEPSNMALLRDFGSQVMAAKTVDNLGAMGVDFKDADDASADSARESVAETLKPKVEQGPEALAGLAQLTGIEIPYVSYSAGKSPKASSLISDNPSLQKFADAGVPILLYGPYAKDGSGSQMHYSVLEPLSNQ